MSGLTGNNILAGSSGQGGYEIEQSLRFNDNDAPYLSKTFASSSNRKTWTLSFWTKRGNVSLASNVGIMECGDQIGTNETEIIFGTGNDFFIYGKTSNTGTIDVRTTQVFRDVSAWYHIVLVVDTTSATSTITGSSTDRVRIYVNGSQVTNISAPIVPALNSDHWINSNTYAHNINKFRTNYYDGYLAEYYFIDGQALDPSNFGETDLLTNQWIPKKYVGTYGTNGFYLNFSNSASLGADSSGNGNNFTPTNLAATDQVPDSPTNNFAVLADVNNPTDIYLEGRLKFQGLSSATPPYATTVLGSFGVSSGKWYYEARANTVLNGVRIGFARDGQMSSDGSIPTYRVFDFDIWDNLVTTNNSYTNDFTVTGSAGDILGLAIDIDNGTASAYINGTLKGSVTGLNTSGYQNLPFSRLGYASGGPTLTMNFGQDSSFAGTETAQNNTDGNGKGDFYYAPPAGYLALCSDNMPTPEIALPGKHFNTVLYTGNGSTQSITGAGFQPDFTWLKHRNSPTAYSHQLYDVVRGATKYLVSNTTGAEVTDATTLTSFDSDGFSLGSNVGINQNTINHVSWNWKAGGTASSNTDGTITSTVSANPTAGFSIVSYTGNGVDNSSIGHGLSQAPELIILKKRATSAENWPVYHKDLTSGYELFLNLTNAQADDVNNATWGDNHPGGITSSVFEVGYAGDSNANTDTFIAYCFHSVEGYSKIGSYSPNNSTDGPFIYLGFRPAFVLIKNATGPDGRSWAIEDNKRDPYNPADKHLNPNLPNAEAVSSVHYVDFVSNGFKLRNAHQWSNYTGYTYIYMAFAESPFKYSNAR